MGMTKTHAINDSDGANYKISTWCGKSGYRCDGFQKEYETATNHRFIASMRKDEVECKSCLKAMFSFEKALKAELDAEFADSGASE